MQWRRRHTEADLARADSASVHLVRTSPGTSVADAAITAVGTLDPFRGATMTWNGNGWDLTRTDGMIYVFSGNQPLQAIRDRHGNQITIQHATGGYR